MRFNLYLFVGLLLLFGACQNNNQPSLSNPAEKQDYSYSFPDSVKLAIQQYCGSCHQTPSPELLDKTTWQKYVLPRMGYLLGRYEDISRDSLIKIQGIATVFPEEAMIADSTWNSIKNFYLSTAPTQLSSSLPYASLPSTQQFKVKFPNYFLSPPSSTLVQFGKHGEIYLGDANTKSLFLFDSQLQLINKAKVREGAVHLDEEEGDIKLTVMGSFSPTDASNGFILGLPKDGQRAPYLMIDSLQRPVHSSYADFNGDGLTDMVISEFGKWTGGLSWWKQEGEQKYQEELLRGKPGATKTIPYDLDKDGDLDILALMAQGDEGVYWYENDGHGIFTEHRLLQFPSSFGSSFFDLVDWNKDGLVDILYTAGDNADYPPIEKPYHGIYIYQNMGALKFEEVFFQPLVGAYKAILEDFDQDNDWDIAAISFFPDFAQQAEASFIYLENQGNVFQPTTIPQSTNGRWITMDAGDPDQDGDIDLLLGSLAFEVVPPSPLLQKWVDNGIPFILLENTTK
ncbi:MAG: VCBS repeat-containing protein [Saprospiraceae bacterium]|nr:VCBS repeat-containing protein [Saprospiraceae bacterium]